MCQRNPLPRQTPNESVTDIKVSVIYFLFSKIFTIIHHHLYEIFKSIDSQFDLHSILVNTFHDFRQKICFDRSIYMISMVCCLRVFGFGMEINIISYYRMRLLPDKLKSALYEAWMEHSNGYHFKNFEIFKLVFITSEVVPHI